MLVRIYKLSGWYHEIYEDNWYEREEEGNLDKVEDVGQILARHMNKKVVYQNADHFSDGELIQLYQGSWQGEHGAFNAGGDELSRDDEAGQHC